MNSDSSDYTAIQIPKWKLILTLREILQVNENDQSSNPNKRKRVKDSSDTFQKQHSEGWHNDSMNQMSYMSRVCELGKQLSSTHRWTATAKIFSAIARQICQCPIVVWKIGAQCLANHQETSNELSHNFANTMAQVGRYAVPTIVFDHLTHLLSIGEHQNSRHFLESHKNKINKDHPPKEKAILNGYRGIIQYIDWMEKKNLTDSDELPGNQLATITTESEVVLIAERAVEFLKESFCCPGNFDVFVAKLIHLLEYYERTDELREVLESYLHSNSHHPTPYVFLYEYLVKYCSSDVEQQIYILKELAEVCPSHHHVLTLCNLLTDQEFLLKVECLVNLVDYEEWRSNISVWKALVQVITSEALRCKEQLKIKAYKEIWDDRSLWWSTYHFKIQDINITDDLSAELVVCKATVVAVMYSSEHEYIQVVKRKLAMGEWIPEMDYLDKTLALTHLLSSHCKIQEKVKSRLMPCKVSERNCSTEVQPTTVAPRKRKGKVVKKGKKAAAGCKTVSSVKSRTMVTRSRKRGSNNRRNIIKVCNTFNISRHVQSSSSSGGIDIPMSRRFITKKGRPSQSEIIRMRKSSSSSPSTTSSSSSESEYAKKGGYIVKSKKALNSAHKTNNPTFHKTNVRRNKNPRIPLIALSSSTSSGSSSSDESPILSTTKFSTSKSQKLSLIRKKQVTPDSVNASKHLRVKKFDSTESSYCDNRSGLVENPVSTSKKSNKTIKHVVQKKTRRVSLQKCGTLQDKERQRLKASRMQPIENMRANDMEYSPAVMSSSDEEYPSTVDPLKFKRVSVVLQRINLDNCEL